MTDFNPFPTATEAMYYLKNRGVAGIYYGEKLRARGEPSVTMSENTARGMRAAGYMTIVLSDLGDVTALEKKIEAEIEADVAADNAEHEEAEDDDEKDEKEAE